MPVLVAALVGEPRLRERHSLFETIEPEIAPPFAHEVGVGRADAHREHRRRPRQKLAPEDAAAVVLDVGPVAVGARAERDDRLQSWRAAGGRLEGREPAPREPDHPERPRAPRLRRHPGEEGADVVLLLLRVLVGENAARGAAAADVHAERGIPVLREIGMADCIATPGVILVPVGRDLQHRGHRSGLRTRWKPEVCREASTVRKRDPEVVDLPDGMALGNAHCHALVTLTDASAGNVHRERDFDRTPVGIEGQSVRTLEKEERGAPREQAAGRPARSRSRRRPARGRAASGVPDSRSARARRGGRGRDGRARGCASGGEIRRGAARRERGVARAPLGRALERSRPLRRPAARRRGRPRRGAAGHVSRRSRRRPRSRRARG